MRALRKVFTPKVRTYIYAVSGIAHGVALVAFGVTEEDWVLWSSAGLGLFDATLALLNTPGVTDSVVEVDPPGRHAAAE